MDLSPIKVSNHVSKPHNRIRDGFLSWTKDDYLHITENVKVTLEVVSVTD